jgi:two-component system chemotaxis response regulator CheY
LLAVGGGKGAQRMKFLLVDDSSTMRQIQKRTLEKLGFIDVLEASDGREALSVLEHTAVDVLLTDWNMPNVNGLELVKAVREKNKTIPIIMVTTEAEKSRVIEAIQAGITDYLIKPFTQEALSAKLRKVTGGS